MVAVASILWRSSLARVTRAGAALAAILIAAGPVNADRAISMSEAGLEQLLSKVKAEHPNASILKVEHERSEGDRKTGVYEVKLLRRDGQVLKLYYDAATLVPMMHGDDAAGDGEHRRRRERRRGNW